MALNTYTENEEKIIDSINIQIESVISNYGTIS
jgi:hypothetical protein